MKRLRRATAILLTLTMFLTMAPAASFAAPVTEEETNVATVADDMATPKAGAAVYVSASGSDESGDGSEAYPYASLAKAVEKAEDGAIIYVMSDLEISAFARIVDKHLTIKSTDDNQFILKRGDNLSGADDNQSWYRPAMIEVVTFESEETENASSVTLENIVLTDNGEHDGKYFAQTNSLEGVNDNLQYVQDSMITAHGKSNRPVNIILGAGAELKDYGGMSAVYATGNAHITMKDGSEIYDETVKDRKKNGKETVEQVTVEDFGPAGAVWIQGGTFTMEQGSSIHNVIGRALYVDVGGKVVLDGAINDLVSDSDMWNGTGGVILHLRGGSTAELNGHFVADGRKTPRVGSGDLFNIMHDGTSFMLNNGAKIQNWTISGNCFYIHTDCNVTLDGEIAKINTNGSHIVQIREADTLTIGENANIHHNKVSYGALYIQAGNIVNVYGKVNANYSGDRGAGIAIANHGGASNHSVVKMYDGAEICGNISTQTGGGVMVCTGEFIMNGGTISENISGASNVSESDQAGGGVFVRQGGQFTMNGGNITDNVAAGAGGGIGVLANEHNNMYPFVLINGGTISDNIQQATVKGVVSDDFTYEDDFNFEGGIANDLAVLNGASGSIEKYLEISDGATVNNQKIYIEKYDFYVESSVDNVKFGNATTQTESAVKNAYSSQCLTNVLGSFWHQSDMSHISLDIEGLVDNAGYKADKPVYAAIVETDSTGNPVESAAVQLYEMKAENGEPLSLTLTESSENGFAVVFLQEGDQPANIITLKPVDLTAYMGGDGGYDHVVADGSETTVSTSLPHPLFQITGVDNAEGMVFSDGEKLWKVVEDGKGYYHFAEGAGQEAPVRVTYTNNKTHETTLSDEFEIKDVGDVFNTYTVALYTDEVDLSKVTATLGNNSYAVATGTGTLTVRAVEADDPTSGVVEGSAPTSAVAAGSATAVVPADTTYTLNGLEGVTIPDDAKPSLLFDEIIESDGVKRTEALKAAVDNKLGSSTNRNYEYKYLDLVDAKNGNAWIKANNPVTIYWGIPTENVNDDTEFKILHFKDLHRDGEKSGFEVEDVNSATIETITPERTEYGLKFEVAPGDFSPYVLAWETEEEDPPYIPDPTPDPDEPDTPDEPDVPGVDLPDDLNTVDHFSYVVGYEDGTVMPQKQITRAEVATIFYRLLKDDVREDYDTTRNNFSDVTSDSWYNQTVSTLASMGIVKGYEDGTFRPNAPITRAEFAAIATRFFEETGATYEPGTFTDVTGSEWFAGAIMDAVNLGLIGGYEDGTVRPNNNITRAEACAIVNRTLGRVPDADHLLPEDEMTTWPDNPSSAWFYADMQEATNGHEYEWITEDGNKVENWTDLLDKDWNDR